jgi:hypothetical protein
MRAKTDLFLEMVDFDLFIGEEEYLAALSAIKTEIA